MPTQGSFPVTIAAPPEQVWPWISDLSKHPQWSPKPYRVELTSGAAGAVGAHYRSVGWIPGDKDHGNDVEITEVVPNQRFAFTATDEQGVFRNSYTLTGSGASSTKVVFDLMFPRMRGMTALAVPVLFPLVGKPDIRKRMQLLKSAVEAETAPDS
jgi:uncharacterized protein YndB with AHSA1/START domain